MADGRYIFRNCVPDGDIVIAGVRPGEIVEREWSFRANEAPELQSLLDSGKLDPRTVLRGYDGRLYDGDGTWLAEVPEWEARVRVTNTDYQPAGKKIQWAIPTSYQVTLTFRETVIRDARLLAKVLDGLRDGQPDAVLHFQGVLYGRA